MLARGILAVAILVQAAVAIKASTHLRIGGRKAPWTLFVGAFALMALSGTIRLFQPPESGIPFSETAELLTSILFLAGVNLISPILQAVKRSEMLQASLEDILDNSFHEILLVDPVTGRFLVASRGAQEALGYTEEELLGLRPEELDSGLSPEEMQPMFRSLLSGKKDRFERPTTQRRKDGSIRPVSVQFRRGRFEGRGVVQLLIEDLTDRKKAETAARQSRERLEEAQNMSHVASWEWDLRTNELNWSDELYRIFGLEPEAVIPEFTRMIQVIAEEDRERIRELLTRSLDEGAGFNTEYSIVRPSGERRRVHGWARIEKGLEQKPTRLLGVSQDITDLRKAEEALFTTETRLRSVVEQAPIILFALDAEGRFTLCEGKGLVALGLQPGELVGTLASKFYENNPETLENVRKVLDGEEVSATVPMGELVFEMEYLPKTNSEGQATGAIVVATDITTRVRAQEEQQKLAATVERSQDFIGLATLRGKFLYLNPAGMALVGLSSEEEVRTKHIWDLAMTTQELKVVMESLKTEGFWTGETHLKQLDSGESIPVSTQTFMVTAPQTEEPLAIATVARDLREEMAAQAEREEMEGLLRQSQKMETIGTLAGGIAHDFNNLLTPILGWSQLIEESLGPGHPLQAELKEVTGAAARAKDLVQQILSFSRRGEEEKQPMDVRPVVKEAVRLLRASLPSSIEIRSNIPENVGWARSDPTQIHQVIMNLGTNALHAMAGQNGTLTVELGEVEVDEAFALSRPALEPGPFIRLTVSDTGVGMDSKTRDRVLEPFFTTKDVGEGTGLGLSVVHGIITGSGGDITIDSEPDLGTTISIYLPVAEKRPQVVANVVEPSSCSPGARVLFVDDKPEILSLAKRMLLALGYVPRVEKDSQEALARIRNAPEEVDILVTDFTMPTMDGLELIQEVRKILPDLPVVMTSGFNEDLTFQRMEEEMIRSYLPKPFVANELENAIRTAVKASKEKPVEV